jgi:hypothetical protein
LTKEDLNKLIQLDCLNPSVTLHVFSAKPNPIWKINLKQINNIKSLVKESLKVSSSFQSTSRIMGYQGFTISCSKDNQIFIHGINSIEKSLLDSGQSYLSSTIIEHVKLHLGQSMSLNNSLSLTRINCDNVPIKGSDNVPTYNPQRGNGGCFIKKQSKNNCYAYGNTKHFRINIYLDKYFKNKSIFYFFFRYEYCYKHFSSTR